MKRCPQCDFIYENDQNFCDIDGNELVYEPSIYEPSPLPLPENTVAQRADPPAKSRWRSLALLPIAGVICGAVPFLVYYGLTPRTAPQNINHSSGEVTADPQSGPSPALAAPAATATPAIPSPVRSPVTNVSATDSAPPLVEPSPAPSPSPVASQEEKRPKPERVIRKKESKIGSVLKKAGRILKNPF